MVLSSSKSTLNIYILFIICCILYFLSIILCDDEKFLDIELDFFESGKIGLSNIRNLDDLSK